ncbi:hypothetical protein Tco_0022010 [Tanacetum coccineum]
MWAEVRESQLICPEIMQVTTKKIMQIKERLKTGIVRFSRKRKLAPRYVGPFEIVKRVGPVAYRLEAASRAEQHSRYVSCVQPLEMHLEEIEIEDKLHFVEEPIEIVERKVKKLKRKRIPIVKVHWNSKRGAEFTWEREDQFKTKYLHLFAITSSIAVNS